MVMDSGFSDLSDVLVGFGFDDELVSLDSDQSRNVENGYKLKDESLGLSLSDIPTDSPGPDPRNSKLPSGISLLDIPTNPPDLDPRNATPSTGCSETNSSDDSLFSDGVLKFLNQILMEDKIEEKPCMFHDPLALQAAEKSFYDVLGKEYPASSHQPLVDINGCLESPNGNFIGCTNGSSGGNYLDPQWVGDSTYHSTSSSSQRYPQESNLQWSSSSVESFNNSVNGPTNLSASTEMIQNIFNDSESILQFNRGMEEASKFLPNSTNFVIDLDNYALPSDKKESQQEVDVKAEKDENVTPSSKGRKHYQRQDSVVYERNKKHSEVYVEEETELLEMFDRVLLSGPPVKKEAIEIVPALHENEQPGPKVGKSRSKKKGNTTKEVDLRTLLISCAQSVAAGDRRTAYEQLKQIRQHSCATGDATQRLADLFANGLEARMAGTGTQIYGGLANKKISVAQKLKAYEVYLSASPFKYISMYFINKMILDKSSNATTLHIIDFGIQYGFQWPMLIKLLSNRSGGPPNLRITGIEYPQPGFRPAERVDDTGRRLANYCERFGVPFEYNAITTQKWDTVKKQDLNIRSDEFVAVNCLHQFKNLADETVVLDSPRDAVLKLIRKLNPDIFVLGVINGSYNAPFFVTRFREALFHYSALFDMFENTIPRDNKQRLDFEREFYGRECINVIACEGLERVERPETYKQWQVRNLRAGFRQLPLDRELIESLRCKVKSRYHKDFVFDEDGNWMLQGWKGRILNAVSCWVPA
ncbi:Scarecrow-like protein 14 [Heracleum sosnowskyi]|uniref:Scarecrow-like protein 14 n=1 Tax=Heracleum sosnowskyi TaxID=360622 RepID=A0AAD8M0G4_9APIA|nr:Scarecrow-like protein 14 [Heracleum sosnowskyi]